MDFAISPKGDLIIEEAQELKGFKLSFRMSDKKGLGIKFFTAEQPVFTQKGQFKLSFVTKEKTGGAHKVTIVDDIEAKIQNLRIALMTERSELPKRQGFGSELNLIKHENIYDKQNLRLIEDATRQAIQEIIPNAEIIAKPEKSIGNFYCQNVSINIYEEDILTFKFFI